MGLEPADLDKIRQRVNYAIAAAYKAYQKDHNIFPEAVNWGDLRCVAVEKVIDNYGDEHIRVCIEEASPDCPELHKFVHEQLTDSVSGEIRVTTEW